VVGGALGEGLVDGATGLGKVADGPLGVGADGGGLLGVGELGLGTADVGSPVAGFDGNRGTGGAVELGPAGPFGGCADGTLGRGGVVTGKASVEAGGWLGAGPRSMIRSE
jgi:hypothetical protein